MSDDVQRVNMVVTKWGGIFDLYRDNHGDLRIKTERKTKDGRWKLVDDLTEDEALELKLVIKKNELQAPTKSLFSTEDQWVEYALRNDRHSMTRDMHAAVTWLDALNPTTIEAILRVSTACPVHDAHGFFGGLLYWITGPPAPTYRPRHPDGKPGADKALHYAFGAFAEVRLKLGDELGMWKEQMDQRFGTGQYDEMDIIATQDGARDARELGATYSDGTSKTWPSIRLESVQQTDAKTCACLPPKSGG